jgi:hypothetical protein
MKSTYIASLCPETQSHSQVTEVKAPEPELFGIRGDTAFLRIERSVKGGEIV